MKIVHFECGLGNQMTCYANYLLVKKNNPDDEVVIENLVYSIDRGDVGFNQWNGFELEDIFGIEFINITQRVTDKNALLSYMEKEYKKNEGQNNSYSAVTALRKTGISFEVVGPYQQESDADNTPSKIKHVIRRFVITTSNNRISYLFRKVSYNTLRKVRRYNTDIYCKRNGNCYYPLSFDVMKDIASLEPINKELRESFVFPEITDERNKAMSRMITECNSVAVHARRSDFLQYNEDCYRFGYFKKAISYIRSQIESPVFFVFSEECAWCRQNIAELGLSHDDKIIFVDWNQGKDSFRDMQLMSMCKHDIITKSSFGWWAAYLNINPDKIIVSQVSEYYSKVYF